MNTFSTTYIEPVNVSGYRYVHYSTKRLGANGGLRPMRRTVTCPIDPLPRHSHQNAICRINLEISIHSAVLFLFSEKILVRQLTGEGNVFNIDSMFPSKSYLES